MSNEAEQVITAGKALEAAGKPINGTALRRALGSRGRPDVLMRMWEAHKQAQDTRPPALALMIENALCALRQPLERLADAAWNGASDGMAARTRELEAALRETEEELGATVDRYEHMLEEARTRIDRLEASLAAAHDRHRTEQHALQDRVRGLEEQLATRDDERQTARALADLLPTLQQALAACPSSHDGVNNAEPMRPKRRQTNKRTIVAPLLDAITASGAPLPNATPP